MPETVIAAGTEQQSGTQTPAAATPAFDPIEGQTFPDVDSERAASGGIEPGKGDDDGGDGGASGKSATTVQDGTDQSAADNPVGTEKAKAEVDPVIEPDPLEDQLRAFEATAKKAAAGTEGTKPEGTEGEITPEKLRAEIEASAQKPEERFEKLLSKVGGFGKTIGDLRKQVGEGAAYKQAFEQVRGLYEFSPDGKAITGLNKDTLQTMLAQHGLEAVPKGAARHGVKDAAGRQYDVDLVDEVIGALGIDQERLGQMEAADKLALIRENPEALLDLREKQRDRSANASRQEQQAQQQFHSEMQSTAMELAKVVPQYKELVPVMEALHADLTKDQSGSRYVHTLFDLARMKQLKEGGMRSMLSEARTSERAKVLKSLASVLGRKPADLETLMQGAAGKAAPVQEPSGRGGDWIRGE